MNPIVMPLMLKTEPERPFCNAFRRVALFLSPNVHELIESALTGLLINHLLGNAVTYPRMLLEDIDLIFPHEPGNVVLTRSDATLIRHFAAHLLSKQQQSSLPLARGFSKWSAVQILTRFLETPLMQITFSFPNP